MKKALASFLYNDPLFNAIAVRLIIVVASIPMIILLALLLNNLLPILENWSKLIALIPTIAIVLSVKPNKNIPEIYEYPVKFFGALTGFYAKNGDFTEFLWCTLDDHAAIYMGIRKNETKETAAQSSDDIKLKGASWTIGWQVDPNREIEFTKTTGETFIELLSAKLIAETNIEIGNNEYGPKNSRLKGGLGYMGKKFLKESNTPGELLYELVRKSGVILTSLDPTALGYEDEEDKDAQAKLARAIAENSAFISQAGAIGAQIGAIKKAAADAGVTLSDEKATDIWEQKFGNKTKIDSNAPILNFLQGGTGKK